jgi:hypothetical protein
VRAARGVSGGRGRGRAWCLRRSRSGRVGGVGGVGCNGCNTDISQGTLFWPDVTARCNGTFCGRNVTDVVQHVWMAGGKLLRPRSKWNCCRLRAIVFPHTTQSRAPCKLIVELQLGGLREL